ncbi:MAG: hypothetical protein QXW97_03660 [Candidatus Pacearchaeota archaeon]
MDLKETIESILRAEEYETYKENEIYKIPLKNIKTLLNIYYDKKGKETIITNIILNYDNPNFSYLGFEFLIRIKEIKKAFEYLEKNLNKLRGIRQIYFKEYYSLFNKCLARLNYLINDTNFEAKEIELLRVNVLDLYRFLPKSHFKLRENYYSNEEVSINYELRKEIIRKLEIKKAELISNIYDVELSKEDIKSVIEKIKNLELSEGLSIAFKKLEERYYEAETKNDFAMFGGYIRQALMGLIKEISLRIASEKNEVIKEKDEHFRNFLKKENVINEGLWRMISAFYDFISCKINHSIETDKEYYKIGLNIASQLSNLILIEYEKYIKKEKKF